jgi:hypothetical protein
MQTGVVCTKVLSKLYLQRSTVCKLELGCTRTMRNTCKSWMNQQYKLFARKFSLKTFTYKVPL